MEYSNPYSYVGNHPLNFTDPMGLSSNPRNIQPKSAQYDDGAGYPVYMTSANTGFFINGIMVSRSVFEGLASAAGFETFGGKYAIRIEGHWENGGQVTTNWYETPYGYECHVESDRWIPESWEYYTATVRVYSSDAFGIKGFNHSYVYGPKTGLYRGMDGSSGKTKGDGSAEGDNPNRVVELPQGMTEYEFMEKIYEYPGWEKGPWWFTWPYKMIVMNN